MLLPGIRWCSSETSDSLRNTERYNPEDKSASLDPPIQYILQRRYVSKYITKWRSDIYDHVQAAELVNQNTCSSQNGRQAGKQAQLTNTAITELHTEKSNKYCACSEWQPRGTGDRDKRKRQTRTQWGSGSRRPQYRLCDPPRGFGVDEHSTRDPQRSNSQVPHVTKRASCSMSRAIILNPSPP
jgi:hypothetical protein